MASDATLQGIVDATSTSASTTEGEAVATGEANWAEGVDLEHLKIGGVASVTGQTSIDGSASAETVAGGSKADYKVDDIGGLDSYDINVASDAQLTGLSNVDPC